MKEIKPVPHIDTTVRIPGSKSITHRALITASLAEGQSLLSDFLVCEDTRYTMDALMELGVKISLDGKDATVTGTGGEFPSVPGRKQIFLGNSGTSYRLLLTFSALTGSEVILTGLPRMNERPVGDLVEALNRLGVVVSCPERAGFPPVIVKGGGFPGGKVKIDGSRSSQYLSSLLLSGPYAKRDLEITVRGKLVSHPYVDLTLRVMEAFGVTVYREGYRHFRVRAGQTYRPCRFQIDGDVSSASYFWAAAALTGGEVVTENIHPFTSSQGDLALLDILQEMGCYTQKRSQAVLVRGGPLSGVQADMGGMPDMVPTIAAIALFSRGKTILRNVAHLRDKESDRLRAIATEWGKLGGRVRVMDDEIIIHGGRSLQGVCVDPHDDHRLAMSLALIGLMVPGVRIGNEKCVDKSFPQFWELWDGLGNFF